MASWLSANWLGLASFLLTVLVVLKPVRRRIDEFTDAVGAMNKQRTQRHLTTLRGYLKGLETGKTSVDFHRNIAGGLTVLTIGVALVFWGFVVHQGDIKGMTGVVVLAFFVAVWMFGSALGKLNDNDLRERIAKLERRTRVTLSEVSEKRP